MQSLISKGCSEGLQNSSHITIHVAWGIVEPAGGGAKMTSSLRNKEMLFTVVKVTTTIQLL